MTTPYFLSNSLSKKVLLKLYPNMFKKTLFIYNIIHQLLIYNLRNIDTYNLAILRFLTKSKNYRNKNHKTLFIFEHRI